MTDLDDLEDGDEDSALAVWVSEPISSMVATNFCPSFRKISSGRTLRDMPVPVGLSAEMMSLGNRVMTADPYSIAVAYLSELVSAPG